MNLSAGSLFSLAGKTVVLTGASGFLGRTMARTLLANGARVIALGRSDRLASEAGAWAEEFGEDKVEAHQVDMYDLPAFGALLETVARRETALDVLVNNAYELGPATGFNTPDGTFETAPPEQWVRNLTGGVVWPALAAQKLGEAMKARRHGSIINVATMYATVAPSPNLYEGTPFMNPPGYSAAKAGMMGLTRYIASFWGQYNVRCNAILPGPFSNTQDETPNAVRGGAGDEFLARLRSRTCLNRTGRPEELSGALLFLASDASSYVTGHGLVVDGGWTTT